MAKRRRFRDQSIPGIILHMLGVMLTEQPPGRARSLDETGDGSGGEGRPAAHRLPQRTVVASALAFLVVMVVVSIVVLIHLYQSTPQTTLAIPVLPTATPAPVVPPATPPPGVPVTTLHRYGASAELAQPQDVLRVPDGRLYVADTGNHRVVIFGKSGKATGTITIGAPSALKSPYSLALTPAHHLLVLDSDAGQVLEYTLDGELIRASSSNLGITHSRGIAVDVSGNILVADPAMNAVYTLGADLNILHTQPAIEPGKDKLFEQPSAVAAGNDASVYVVDSQNNRVEQFSSEWQLLQQWPVVVSDTLHSPRVSPLASGDVLVSDPVNGKILLFSSQSPVPKVFNVPDGAACQPLGLALGGDNDVLVTCALSGNVLDLRLPGHVL